MIEASISTTVSAPYSDPRAGNSSVKDDGRGGSFGDALSTVKDDRHQQASHSKAETDTKASGQKHDDQPDEGAEKSNAATRRSASFLDAIAAERTVEGKDARLPSEFHKPVKSDRTLQENGKTGKKGKEEAEEKAETTDAGSIDPNLTVAKLFPAQAGDTTGARSALDDIAQVLGGKADTAKSQKVGDAKEKIDPSLKDISAALKVASNEDQPEADNSGDASGFRFASSRSGAGRSLDMSTVQREGKVDFEVKDSAVGKGADTIAVLDSRRFIGLAPSTNASALTGLIANDPEWVSAMQPGSSLSNAAAQSSTGKVVHTLKLHMTPIELGSVTMSLRLAGDELAVHMTVESMAAYKKLQEDSKSILDGLKAQGLTVDSISISIASSDKSDQTGTQSNNQQNQQTQQQGHQAASGRNRDESGARGGQQGGRDVSGVSNEGMDGAAGSSRAAGDTGVYL
ncbi:flagellar hook-length control protein FliK [Agrobacterium tumefaciens]|uniref:flagellar hook-length control protein FliK n=1 Tax=Agrobacterium tumefaciens TaxID=358 RepID=UPI00287C18AF|nr:flagellar hook-length control protein FliK [Agrobacterium tumefaciens]MDS7596181.1 flagellar hook-length control protein FliK [Agrobacterium tumefaciens]